MEKERLIYSINRFDHYFDSVNNKTAVYIAITTFVLTASVMSYFSIAEIFPEIVISDSSMLFVNIMLGLISLLGIVTLNILIFASRPFFSKKSQSLYYFGGIGSMKYQKFVELSKNRTEKEDLKDLRNQVHTLSQGLSKKFSRLTFAGQILFIQFLLVFALILFLLIFKYLTYGNL